MEALASRARTLCLQGQFGRAAKILSLEGTAPDNRKTFNEFEKRHPGLNAILEPLEDYSCKIFQFDEANVFLELVFFSNFTAARPVQKVPRTSSPRNQLFHFRSIQASNEYHNEIS